MRGNLKSLKERLRGTRKVLQVTQAMEHIASVRMMRSRSLLEAHLPYFHHLGTLLRLLAGSSDPHGHPLLTTRDAGRVALVVFGADRGLCGGYNSAILDAAETFSRETPPGTALVAVGRIIRDRMLRNHLTLEQGFLQPPLHDFFPALSEIAKPLAAGFRNGLYREVHAVYSPHTPGRPPTPARLRLLPLPMPGEPGLAAPPPARAPDRKHFGLLAHAIREPGTESLLRTLAPEYFRALLTHIFFSSSTAEHTARHIAMVRARDNAGEMVDELTLAYNHRRQEQITTEMTELAAGAQTS